MSWIDNLLNGGSGPTITFNQFTPAQLMWFQQKGINPTMLTPQQLAIANQQMNAELTQQEDARLQAERQAQEEAARQAQAKALQEALEKQAAEQKASEEAARIAAEEAAKKANPTPPIPVVDPTPKAPDPAIEAQRIAALRDVALNAGKTGARQYFSSRGVDPTDYGQSIDDAIAAALSGVPTTEQDPLSKLNVTGIASDIYGNAEANRRAQLTTQLSNMFPETFANTRVDPSLDDSIISAIIGEQRGGADAVVNNMLRRGVITPTGANAARGDLDSQQIIAKDRLNTLGTDLLSSERSNIGDIISRANKTASALPLGTNFDPNTYSSEVDKQFNDFVNSLPTTLRARTPGNLFTTSGLGAIAGAAQGAGNTKFDPNALAGVLEQSSNDAANTTKPKSSRITDYVF